MRRLMMVGNGAYVVFGDDGLMYLGAKIHDKVFADVSRSYTNLHVFKGGLMLMNKVEDTYVVLREDTDQIVQGEGMLSIGTDVAVKGGILSLTEGYLTGEDAIIYAVKTYGDTDYIHTILQVLLMEV